MRGYGIQTVPMDNWGVLIKSTDELLLCLPMFLSATYHWLRMREFTLFNTDSPKVYRVEMVIKTTRTIP